MPNSHTLLSNLKNEKLLTVTNIFIITFSFFLLGILVNLIVYSQTIIKNLEREAQISIFYLDEYPENKILEHKTLIETDKKVLKVEYVSKQQAFERFTELHKDDKVLLESVTPQILPASLKITSKSISDLENLYNQYKTLEGIEEVKYLENVAKEFSAFSLIIYVVGFGLTAMFFFISYSVIISSIRLAIDNKKEEIEIMKLVGATKEYIEKPFIQQGVFFTTVSAFLASIIVFILALVMYITKSLPTEYLLGIFANLGVNTLLFQLIAGILFTISGVLLGYIGSRITLKKHLKF